jgi:hypothetical protein
MKVVFHFDGSEALKRKVAALGVELCPGRPLLNRIA